MEYDFINQLCKANASSPTMKQGISVSSDGKEVGRETPMVPSMMESLSLELLKILTVRRGLVGTDIYPGKPVISISQGKEYDGVKPLVVVVHRASTSRTADADMLAVQCPNEIVEVSMDCKLLSFLAPLSRCSRTGDDLMAELLNDGLENLANEVADSVVRNPETIYECLVGITTHQVLQCDSQLQAYRQGSMVDVF